MTFTRRRHQEAYLVTGHHPTQTPHPTPQAEQTSEWKLWYNDMLDDW